LQKEFYFKKRLKINNYFTKPTFWKNKNGESQNAKSLKTALLTLKKGILKIHDLEVIKNAYSFVSWMHNSTHICGSNGNYEVSKICFEWGLL
jgi:hypothetical protein